MKLLTVLLLLLLPIVICTGCGNSIQADNIGGLEWKTLQLGTTLTFQFDGLDSTGSVVPGAPEILTYTVDSVDLQSLGAGSRYLSSSSTAGDIPFLYNKDGDFVWSWARFAAGPHWVTLPFRSGKTFSLRIDTVLSLGIRYTETMVEAYVGEESIEVADTAFMCAVVRQCYSGRSPDRNQFKYDSISTLYYYAPSLGFIAKYDEQIFKVDSSGRSFFSHGQLARLKSVTIR